MKTTVKLSIALVLILGIWQSVLGQTPASTVKDIAWNPIDSNEIAIAYGDGRIAIQNLTTQAQQTIFTPQTTFSGKFAKVSWHPQGQFLAAGVGSTVYIWQKSGSSFQVYHQVLIGSADGIAHLESGNTPDSITALDWSYDGSFVGMSSLSGGVKVWRRADTQILFSSSYLDAQPVAWSSNTNRVLVGTQSIVFTGSTPQITQIPVGVSVLTSVDWKSDDTFYAFGDVYGFISIVNALQPQITKVYRPFLGDIAPAITDVAWLDSQNKVIETDTDGRLVVLDAATGQVNYSIDQNGPLYAVDVDQSGTKFAYGGETQSGQSTGVTIVPVVSILPSPYTCTVSGIATEAALKTAITNANGVSTPSVICLQPNSIISVTTLAAPDNSAGDSFLPVIQRDITIVGNGSTLKRGTGAPQGRFFRVSGVNAKLTLDGITVTGGIAGGSYYGGAIRVDGRTLILKNNTILTGNTAQIGGAIWNNLGTVQVENSTLSSNTATQDGGALYGIGTFTLTNSTVHQNSTMNNGGGLYVYSGSGVVSQVTLTNVNLTNNTVTLNGGGLYFATSGTVTINGSQVKNNSAANYGGGLYLSAGTTTITNTLFEANTTTNSSSLGGAIYDTGATTALNLTDTVFNLNTTKNWGGAIYNDNADLTVMRGAFTNNKVLASGSDGGAIFTINTSASVIIQNTRLVGNTALDQGGAMTLSSGTGSITGSCLSQNSAPNGAAVYSNNAFTATNNWWNNAPPPVNSNVTTNPVTPGATCPLP